MMKVYTKVSINMRTGEIVSADYTDYRGPVALCKGGGSSSGGDSTTTQRYAPYLESAHQTLLNRTESHVVAALKTNPFTGYDDIDVTSGFFGTGYLISSFPSLYDMFGKFMAGLDIGALYDQIYADTVNSAEINDLVSAEASLMDDDIEANSIPRFQTGMRDMNAVMSSSFVIGKALIEDGRDKALSRFSSELRFRMIPVAVQRFGMHLKWNADMINTYMQLMKLYYATRLDTDDANYSMATKEILWPFTVMEYERAALGAALGATTTTGHVAGASRTSKVLAGMASGAAIGSMGGAGLGWGTAIGAVAGGVAGLFS